jgi:RecA-family ATPase
MGKSHLITPSCSFNPTTAAELVAKEFTPPRWAIPGLILSGLTVLAGPPKIGKSWMVLDLCLAVATGGLALGSKEVEQGEALFLALEDSQWRIKNRLLKIAAGEQIPDSLHIITATDSFPTLDQGGLKNLIAWLQEHPQVRLVVIDTLERVLEHEKQQRKGGTQYSIDVKDLAPLQSLALTYNLALVVVHHTRKQGADDYVDQVLGSRGITGTADCVAILSKARFNANANLKLTGRDIEEQDLSLAFSEGKWQLIGKKDEVEIGTEKQRIISLIRDKGPMTPAQVAKELDKNNNTVRVQMRQLYEKGLLQDSEKGIYSLIGS